MPIDLSARSPYPSTRVAWCFALGVGAIGLACSAGGAGDDQPGKAGNTALGPSGSAGASGNSGSSSGASQVAAARAP